jgi:hypothetical protein
MSNNSFDISDVPPWITSLQYLTTLYVSLTPPPYSVFVCVNSIKNLVKPKGGLKCVVFMNILTLYGRMMEHTQLEGPIPANLLSLPNLEIVWVSA